MTLLDTYGHDRCNTGRVRIRIDAHASLIDTGLGESNEYWKKNFKVQMTAWKQHAKRQLRTTKWLLPKQK